jgi:hypothetical protein
MSKLPIFTKSIQDKCEMRWRAAYFRGISWGVGQKYPFNEPQYLEFKGVRNPAYGEWTLDSCEQYSFKYIAKVIAAFLNGCSLTGCVPFEPARVVFGVHDKGTKHGILMQDITYAAQECQTI